MCDIHGCVNMQPIGKVAQETAGGYICTAHDIMTSSKHAVLVTHNDFQGTTANDTTGLIPVWTGMPPVPSNCFAHALGTLPYSPASLSVLMLVGLYLLQHHQLQSSCLQLKEL